jgi:hypothetical protein
VTKLSRFLVVLLVLLSAFLVYTIVRRSASRPMLFASDVSEDSIMVYAGRADSLSAVAESLKAEFNRIGIINRPGLSLRMTRLGEEISGLRQAIARWNEAQHGYDREQAYHECILIYGRASGICEGLKIETDTTE